MGLLKEVEQPYFCSWSAVRTQLQGIELPVNSYQRKAEKVSALYPDASIIAAYGDTLSDLPMLEISDNPVAVYPDAKLHRVAKEKGWRVIPVNFR
ncbi:MAG: hypothetical protein ISR58_19150 [Anaerolineales bacterium]|nr:hypothetical protein [Chloroflexota bacterium]MBL6983301.1 hypothetical protein [Anaerolineales bacterium]